MGVVRWLTTTGRLTELESWQQQKRRAEEFSQLLLDTREQLRGLYMQPLGAVEMNYRKHQLLGQLKYRYEKQRGQWGGYTGYDSWFARTLNNADLVPAATYRRCIPGFRRVLDAANGDLGEFYRRVRVLALEEPAVRQRALCTGA
jgi:predicted aminopeptidase